MQNFWRYVSTLDRKNPSRPTLRDKVTGEQFSDVKKRIAEYMQNVFGAPAPVAAAETEVHMPPAPGDAQETDREWKVA
ncbi:hypothetical protein MRX96_058726 [Rhipicephalus microplus]